MAEKEPKILTVREVSERTGAAIPTVNLWCRRGKLTGARQEISPYGLYWLIPETALAGIVVRGRGRPPTKPESAPAPAKRVTGQATRKPAKQRGRKVK